MGVDIHVRIAMADDDGRYESVDLFRKLTDGSYERVSVFDGRNYELFELLQEDVPSIAIMEATLPPPVAEEVRKWMGEFGGYGFREVTLADLMLYCERNPKVPDYDSEVEDATKDNPVCGFMHDIISYIDFSNPFCLWSGCYGTVRIIYWFDH